MLFYILSRLGSISRGLACYSDILSRLGSICRDLACYSILIYSLPRRYSIACHALAVSAKAWHAIQYLVTPWQDLLRLGMLLYILSRLGPRLGMLLYILSRLGRCYYISCHALAVSVLLVLPQ